MATQPSKNTAHGLEHLPGSNLYEIPARDLRLTFGRFVPVLVRADTRADALARLRANDFDPLLDGGDIGDEPACLSGPAVSTGAAFSAEIPAA